MTELDYYIVDAFTNERFAGNPAAVIMDASDLYDQQMQAIAAEFNLSETTFILPISDTSHHDEHDVPSFQFRWFTPTMEVDMCGHATIAGIHALVESGQIKHDDPTSSTIVHAHTRSGKLTISVESMPNVNNGETLRPGSRMIWLELMPPSLTPFDADLTDLWEILSIQADAFEPSMPSVVTQDHDLLVFVKDVMALNDARPDFAKMSRWMSKFQLRGMSLATIKTLSPVIHVQSRFFAPSVGINEDPVTGSVHGPLVAYLVEKKVVPVHDGVAGLNCVQGISGGRTGILHALVHTKEKGDFEVQIGGQSVTVMKGVLYL